MIKVFIADDHAVVRQGLKQILAEARDMAVVGEACCGAEAVRKIRDHGCDVILLDVSMPGKNVIDTLRQIREEKPRLPVLILSMYPEEQYAVRLLKAGACGYLTKESPPEQLLEAIRKVAQGKKYLSPQFAEVLALELGENSERPPHEALSNREYHVFRLLSSGKTVSEIAEAMSLSVKTVSTYRSRILEKMKMKNNAELTYYAAKNNLLAD